MGCKFAEKSNDMTRNRTNILIGVLTGILVGFVFGAAFGAPKDSLETNDRNLSGDIGGVLSRRISTFSTDKKSGSDTPVASDSLKYKATDTDGKEIEIIIVEQ